LAAKIKAKMGVESDLIPGARGSFEVIRDGRLVFSKLDLGRFPNTEGEVLEALATQ
jgi:selT/selW/selH-like putative selenoprotein